MRSINRIENRRFGIKSNVTANRQRRLLGIPDVARAAGGVRADAKRRMIVSDAETQTIGGAQKLVLIHQFESGVEIIPVQKFQSRFCHITVQVKNFAAVTFMISAPDQARSPVAAFEGAVVTDRRGRATHVAGFERLGIPEKAVTDLHGPVAVRREPESRGTRVPRVRFEVVTILVRLAAVEDGAFEFEPAITESGRYHAETDVTRILQVMRQRRRRVLRSRGAMHKSSWSKRRLAGTSGVDKPARAFADRHGVARAHFHEQVVWMLSIDQRPAFVSLSGLKEQRRAARRKGERLGAHHGAQLECSRTSTPDRGRHEPVCRLDLGYASRPTLAIDAGDEVVMKHQQPFA